ncbi:MAG TPA: hypothetical protein VJM31_15630 [Vicinamibacterales bacterium]|nr:hypothetical protein [Vicinamibacterales bacterium]
MHHRFLPAACSLVLFALAFGCSKSEPLTPTVPTATPVTPPAGATLKITAPTPLAPVSDVRLETFTTPTLNASAAQPTEGATITPQYRFQLFNEANALVQDSGLRSSPSWTPTSTLEFDKRYTWQVRAELDGDLGPWSSRESFLTLRGSFQRGQEINDLLTNGQTVGTRYGGTFIPGQGWKANGQSDGIDYDIPTCNSCTVEFDVTGFGKGEGRGISKDLKWLSMGDGTTWGAFGTFRNHVWKMHLEQRGDGNGTGMKLIWRNGRNGDGEPGDHDEKIDPTTINWRQSGVFHFTVTWSPRSYEVSVGEVQPDGSVTGNQVWFNGSFSRSYSPPNHRISIGTRSRQETLEGIYRNFKVYPGPPK